MNVKETIEYLNHRSEYDRMVENYFVVYDQSLVASSPLLAFMERIAPYWWRRELAVVDEKDLALLIEAKTHLSDNPYILAYLEFLIGCKTNDFRPFANALDRSLDAYCGGAKTFRDESNLFFLIGHTKMIGRDVDTHILSLLVQRIGHPKVSRSDISLINRVIHFFGPIKIRSIKTFGKFLSEITDGEKKELDETVAMCRLIRNWMSLYSNDAKIAKKKFIDLVLNNLVPMPDQSFQKTLQLCEDYVCETNYRKVMLPLLGAEIEKAGKEMLTKMQSVDISLPPDLEEKIKESNKKHKDFLAKLTNRDKLLWFTENLPIFARQEMIDQAKKQKENDCWGQFCESQILDKDGR
ncbi:MAG: hypothetical protein J5736_05990, partial [Bacilli bacterium]|nr:hypothetical protein [Bacilli bacterium]